MALFARDFNESQVRGQDLSVALFFPVNPRLSHKTQRNHDQRTKSTEYTKAIKLPQNGTNQALTSELENQGPEFPCLDYGDEEMGMYDYLRCDYPLPDAHMRDALFQTKDTSAMYLEHYLITTEGRLVHKAVEYYDVPAEERPFYDPQLRGFKSEVDAFCGSLGQKPLGDVEVEYHGDICFYTSVGWFPDGAKTYYISDGQGRRVTDGPWEPATEEWFEYQARFTNGRVEWIKRVPNQDN